MADTTADRRTKIEVLHAVPESALNGPPLLFVHGAFCGAWVWAEHFLPFFAKQGIAAHALSLRGHGGSGGHEDLRTASMSDYVDDVLHVMDTLEASPVLVGHSMGGMVVQRVLEHFDSDTFAERRPVAGAVLMASVPPGGLLGTAWHMATNDPLLLWQMASLQTFGESAATLEGIRRAMFSDVADPDLVTRYYRRMQAESQRVQWDMSVTPPPVATNGRAIPMLVVGADQDSFVPPWMARLTARHYAAPCEVLDNAGHAMMLGPSWQRAATVILTWLTEVGIVTAA